MNKFAAKKIDSFIIKKQADQSWNFKDILYYIKNSNKVLKIDEINQSKEEINIESIKMNQNFDIILTKAFRLAFIKAER